MCLVHYSAEKEARRHNALYSRLRLLFHLIRSQKIGSLVNNPFLTKYVTTVISILFLTLQTLAEYFFATESSNIISVIILDSFR